MFSLAKTTILFSCFWLSLFIVQKHGVDGVDAPLCTAVSAIGLVGARAVPFLSVNN